MSCRVCRLFVVYVVIQENIGVSLVGDRGGSVVVVIRENERRNRPKKYTEKQRADAVSALRKKCVENWCIDSFKQY